MTRILINPLNRMKEKSGPITKGGGYIMPPEQIKLYEDLAVIPFPEWKDKLKHEENKLESE